MRRALALTLVLPGAAAADCLDLKAIDLALYLEEPVELKQDHETAALQFEPQSRSPRGIALQRLQAGSSFETTDWPEQVELGDGWTLAYVAGVSEDVGSGGSEAQLMGWLSGPVSLAVSCSMQGEDPDPTWCIPMLGKLRARSEGCKEGGE